PLTWKSNDPSYAGFGWSVKNFLEIKNAQRVLVDGNIFENSWAMAQVGFAVLFTVRNQSGTCPWCVDQDITFTHNIIRHSASGLDSSSTDDANPSQDTKRVLIKDNLFYDIDRAAFGGDGRIFLQTSSFVNRPATDITMDHNTALHAPSGGNALDFVGDFAPV